MQGNALAQRQSETTPQNRSERVFNLCRLSDEQRQIAAIDTEVCYWLWLRQAGKVMHTEITAVLRTMDKPTADLYRERLNHWRDEFRPSVKSVERFAAISTSTWGRLLASFKKQTARFNGQQTPEK